MSTPHRRLRATTALVTNLASYDPSCFILDEFAQLDGGMVEASAGGGVDGGLEAGREALWQRRWRRHGVEGLLKVPGQPYPSVDGYRSCECWSHKTPDATSADGFHLEKRMTSVSYLQEAWVFLLRLMGKMALFPLGSRDRTYSGVENWAARLPVGDRNKYVNHIMERYWIIKYIRQAAPSITGPKCLEWGNPNKPGQELLYASLVAGCTENYDMQFDGNYWLGTQMHVEGNVIHSTAGTITPSSPCTCARSPRARPRQTSTPTSTRAASCASAACSRTRGRAIQTEGRKRRLSRLEMKTPCEKR